MNTLVNDIHTLYGKRGVFRCRLYVNDGCLYKYKYVCLYYLKKPNIVLVHH